MSDCDVLVDAITSPGVSFVLGEVVHNLAVFFRRQAIWALVPLTLYVFAELVPFDTFRPRGSTWLTSY